MGVQCTGTVSKRGGGSTDGRRTRTHGNQFFLVSPRAKQIVATLAEMEGGQHEAHGKSGEKGALQYLRSTYEAYSIEAFGTVLPFNLENEYLVAHFMVEKWLSEGYGEEQIALIWNQGNPGKCKSGINSKGVPYDSCEYARKFLELLWTRTDNTSM